MALETPLQIIDFNHRSFGGNVQSVTVPSINGYLTILPHHIPLVTPLGHGEIKIVHSGGTEEFLAVSGGFLVVMKKQITILADSAEHTHEMNEQKIMEAKERAEQALKNKQFADDRSYADAVALLERSINQLKILKKRRR